MRFIAGLMGLVLFSLIFIVAQSYWGGSGDNLALGLAAPQEQVVEAVSAPTYSLELLRSLPDLAQENRLLRQQSQHLRAECERLRSLEQENKRLNALLKLQRNGKGPSLAALVVARDPNLWYQQITLNKGSEDGVHDDMVAVASGGLVGRVSGLSSHSCRVRLLHDERIAVPVVLAQSGAVGILYGQGTLTCLLKYVRHDVHVSEGEAVLTSGLGDVYPAGIVVGHVGRLYGRVEAMFQDVQVLPAADFASLSEVLLLSANKPGATVPPEPDPERTPAAGECQVK